MCHSYWTKAFAGRPEQVAAVREFVRQVIGDVDGADDVVLVASELAANAIRHSRSGNPGGSFELEVAAFTDCWHVRVSDNGGSTSPESEDAEETDEAGRGLPVVAALARAWGVIGDSAGRTVWVEIAYPRGDIAAEFYEGIVEHAQQAPALSVVSYSLECRPTVPLVPR